MRRRRGSVLSFWRLLAIAGLSIALLPVAFTVKVTEGDRARLASLQPLLSAAARPVGKAVRRPRGPHLRPGEGPRAVVAADLLPRDVFDDGGYCSIGCRPAGAISGWPLKPFHRQHPLRAGLNEIRPGSLHEALDIQARNGQRVYAIQPGYATVEPQPNGDYRVRVGNYIYWHIEPHLYSGEYVEAYSTVLGTVLPGFGHIAFSEVGADGEYLNPLRPGGRVLAPYVQRKRPVISRPVVHPDGVVTVAVAAPQSFVRKTTYWTPILAPAALAYRVWNRNGEALTPLEFALRSTHVYPLGDRELIYTPAAHEAGFTCFATRKRCHPYWDYNLAGGLAPRIELGEAAGAVRLSVYAWDYAGDASAYDVWVHETPDGLRVAAPPRGWERWRRARAPAARRRERRR